MKKLQKYISLNPLFYAFLLPLFMDAFMTLYGQDVSYWINYKNVNEAAPIYFILQKSPYAYLLLEIVWFVFVYILVKKLKHPINLMLTMLFIVGHTHGSTGWILRSMRHADFYDHSRQSITIVWCLMIAYFASIGVWSSYFLSQYFKKYPR